MYAGDSNASEESDVCPLPKHATAELGGAGLALHACKDYEQLNKTRIDKDKRQKTKTKTKTKDQDNDKVLHQDQDRRQRQ